MFKKSSLKNINFILIIILGIAAGVRYWGIHFGFSFRPDEEQVVGIIDSAFNPIFFNHPAFYKYIVLFFYKIYFLIGLIFGKYKTIADFMVEYRVTPENFYFINRYVAAFLGTLTVLIVYRITKKLFDKRTAVISALFMGLAYLHVRDSHFGVTDTPLTFLVMLFTFFLIKVMRTKSLSSYIYCGILAGLAASTKYPGVLVIFPMLIIHFLNIIDSRQKLSKLILDKRIIFFILVCAFFYLLGNPHTLLSYGKFKEGLLRCIRIFRFGDRNVMDIGWFHHLKFSLFYGLGWPLFFTSLAGFIVIIKTNFRRALLLCSFPVVYYAVFGQGYNVFLRYALPLVPFFCIAAAVFTADIMGYLERHLKARLVKIAVFLIPVLIILPSVYNILCFDSLLSKKDNRLIAGEWVNSNLAEGSSIAQSVRFATYGVLMIYPTVESLRREYARAVLSNNLLQEKYSLARINFMKNNDIKGFNEVTYDRLSKLFISKLDGTSILLPDYIIVEESPLEYYSLISREPIERLRKSYYLLKEFPAIDIKNKTNLFDQQDIFYMPLVGFKGVRRPGPNIYIYARKPV